MINWVPDANDHVTNVYYLALVSLGMSFVGNSGVVEIVQAQKSSRLEHQR